MAEDERTNGRGLDGFPLDMQNYASEALERKKKGQIPTSWLIQCACAKEGT